MEGWIPIWIERNAPSREEMLKSINPWKSNMHKPTLAQHAAFIVRNMNGDAEWLRNDFYRLQAFVSMYLNHHRHKATGLIYGKPTMLLVSTMIQAPFTGHTEALARFS